MKKNLAVRIGAIVMALMVAFFSILPDLVNAEGDDTDILTEAEIMAEAPEEVPEVSQEEGTTDLPAEETPDEGTDEGIDEGNVLEGDIQEPEITEPEAPVDEDDLAEDPSEDDTDSKDETDNSEVLDEENPSPQEPNEGEDLSNPEDSDQIQPEEGTAADTDSSEKDTIDDYLAMLDDIQLKRVKGAAERFDSADKMADIELFVTEESDFLTDETGTVLLKYLGNNPYVQIPPAITVISDGAFAGNTTLVGVVLPVNLQTIGNSAFNGCCNLGEISIPDSVTSVGDSAFANCTGLAGVSIGSGTGTVSSNEFYNCVSLQSVAVPEGISSISSGAFVNCSNLSSISLPSTLASLDRGAFAGDTNLASISVAGGAFSSYDGCVYTGDGSQLLLCPQGKTGISMAPQTVSIASGAFNGCSYLLSAVVPDAANSVESNAFSGSAIKSVTIPRGVTSIGSQSGWAPNVVYGYSGTTAEVWANQNNYVFESLNAVSGGGNTVIQDEHIEDEDSNNEEENPEETESGTGSKKNTKASAGTVTGTGTTAAISRNAGNRTNATATPKTGVEDYGIYFLSAGIFLMGIAFFAYSKKLHLDR